MVDLATNALSTLATVASDLGITTPGTSDDLLKRLINSASQAIEQYCQRSFYRDTAITEKVAGFGTEMLMVSRTPINALTSVALDGATVSDVTIEDANAGLLMLRGGFQHTIELMGGRINTEAQPDTERKAYTVVYDGGWYTPKQYDDDNDNTRALPYDVEEACIEFVRALYYLKQRDPAVASQKLLSWAGAYQSPNYTTQGQAAHIPPWVRTMIDSYVRVA